MVITQARHPLEGSDLRVLGWMRRLGRLELMLELPDGSKRLIPAEHTSQHDDPDPGPGTGTLGRTADLLALSVLVSALCTRSRDDREQAARNPPPKEDIVQPVELSLLPDQVPRAYFTEDLTVADSFPTQTTSAAQRAALLFACSAAPEPGSRPHPRRLSRTR